MSEWNELAIAAPYKAGYYIVGNREVRLTGEARWMPNLKQWRFASAQRAFDVTHWMPLPEPPK